MDLHLEYVETLRLKALNIRLWFMINSNAKKVIYFIIGCNTRAIRDGLNLDIHFYVIDGAQKITQVIRKLFCLIITDD